MFYSISFRIIAAMLLIAIVPVAASLIIFDRIDAFNQNLQQDAIESINDASNVYKAWVKSEANLVEITKRNLQIEVDHLVQMHAIQSARGLRNNTAFLKDLQALFDRLLAENNKLSGLYFFINMQPLASAHQEIHAHGDLQKQAFLIPLNIRTRFKPSLDNAHAYEADHIPMLVANPEMEMIQQPTSALPETIDETKHVPLASLRSLQFIAVFALDRSPIDRYQKLGDMRYVHNAIATINQDQDNGITDIYQIVFYSLLIIAIVLALMCAFCIAIPLSRRLTELTCATHRVANGDLDAKLHVQGNDQVAALMKQFNHMVDELKEAHESKAYIERMQAWQEVARRLAHELKNPLTPIVLAVQQLDKKFQDYTDQPQKYRKLLTNAVEIVTEESETIVKLVRNFSEFARLPMPEKKSIPLWTFLQQTIEQNPQLTQNACVHVHPCTDMDPSTEVAIDPELMRRVLINLVRNGIEAAQNAGISPCIDLFLAPSDDPKYAILLRIRDNGPGLTQAQIDKLFTPYFTTKSDGTGLGLSIVRKIIEDHGGKIHLHNREDPHSGAQADILLE